MTKLQHYVEEMRARLTEVSETERTLIRELDDALCRLDQRLLADVRDLTTEHEARRVAVLTELQSLASRMGAFPASDEPLTALEDAKPGHVNGYAALDAEQEAVAGDWRQAVSKIDEDIESLFGRRGTPH